MFEIHHLFLKLIIKLGLSYNSICWNSYSGKHGKKFLSCSVLGTEAPWLRQLMFKAIDHIVAYLGIVTITLLQFGNLGNH